MSETIFYVELRGTLRLCVHEWSNRGPWCLLLHGFGDGSFVWDDLAPELASSFRVLALDLRGHGESDWDPARRYSSEVCTADVIAVLDALEIDNVRLIGHSLGGEIAVRVASSLPSRVSAVIVVDYGPELNREGIERVLAEYKAAQRLYCSVSEYADWLQKSRPLLDAQKSFRLASKSVREAPIEGYTIKSDPAIADGFRPSSESSLERWRELKELRCPTLVMRGLGSAVLSKNVALRMASGSGNIHLRTVEGAGHAIMSDNPVVLNRLVLDFLSCT